jgi:hypothetical protein
LEIFSQFATGLAITQLGIDGLYFMLHTWQFGQWIMPTMMMIAVTKKVWQTLDEYCEIFATK